ncbi:BRASSINOSTEROID INSENSITIVE 1-associated receptor kinase 1 [Monoraphidium neglectum]|uniref:BRASSINOSTEROID INSENSITIVE 1-associated receptor kinase 1 n=1 Tax=Monoraphidium neglectum TaxID=145388 RepID=A0A0D2M731_9CHLO|nr:BRASSINOSTEROID INSENSITIVE 1-associated receptor kinase 1 [Monoraphidium neglectum]KIY99154.1 BRASSINOSTEROID INSENSITIVE 1-associated receptor kinase 1 [Monoraphidium neglectum]|eukprot:XP_013898174.1 BRASSINOSTEROID INSENSITIVE 1-associated receptor kinase 1 [Monoraphidium neglectum]
MDMMELEEICVFKPTDAISAVGGGGARAARASVDGGAAGAISGWEVRLVLEYCDLGTLRERLDDGALARPDGPRDLGGVLATALEVARALAFLHENGVVHADLKARNVLLKSNASDPRGFIAKVGDFGLSMQIDPGATYISNLFQGTMTHMAPETMEHGRLSRASDVYGYGILLFELMTGQAAFKGVPRAVLGYDVMKMHRRPAGRAGAVAALAPPFRVRWWWPRPHAGGGEGHRVVEFPNSCPQEFADLAALCWHPVPDQRYAAAPLPPPLAAALPTINFEGG